MPRQPATTRPRRPTNAWDAAALFGCDMALLEDSLRMSPAQRVIAHQQALNLVEELLRVRGPHHVRSQ